MRRDEQYLQDILDASEAVERYLAGLNRAGFLADELRRDAVARRLTIVGEAATRVSVPVRNRAPKIDWARAVDFRNLVVGVIGVDGYFEIDWSIVWRVAWKDLPHFRRQVEALIRDLADA